MFQTRQNYIKRAIPSLLTALAAVFAWQAFAATGATKVESVKAVIGKVTSVNVGTKVFSVASVSKGAVGEDISKQIEVQWSVSTRFLSKSRDKKAAAASDLKVGKEVVVRINAQWRKKPIATDVWVQPSRGPVNLSKTECKDLGGQVFADMDCPGTGGHNRCKTYAGSSCITE